jgi:hypothetical protein
MLGGAKRSCGALRRRRNSTYLLGVAIAGVAVFRPAGARADLTFLNTWGGPGSGQSEFDSPTGLTVAPDGTVYVTDQNNERVEYFSPTGTFLGQFGTSGTGLGGGQFSNPSGVAVSALGTVYVADFRNNDVQLFTETGNYESYFGGTGAGNGDFEGPDGVAIGPTGLVYVTDQEDNRVEIFSSTGTFISTFGSFGSNNGQLDGPAGLAVGPTGLVYVPDFENNRVEIFSAAGVFQSSFGSGGTVPGDFEGPLGVGVGPTGLVYVADDGNDRVEVFNSAGVFESSFGVDGTGPGQFQAPFDVSVLPNGMVYVLDGANDRVERLFDPNSWTTGTNSFTSSAVGPISVAVGSGQLLGTSLTLNTAMGLVVANNITVETAGLFTQAGGSISSAGLTVNGQFVYQSGSFAVGTAGLTVSSGALMQADKGGALMVSSAATINGELTLDNGTTLTSNGATIGTSGLLVVGQGTVTEASGDTLTVNSGGELRLTDPVNAIVSATMITNSGLLDGSGQINGTLANTSTGNVSVDLGQSLSVTGSGNTNAGAIMLSGGSIHYTHNLTNSFGGVIEGFGALRVDGGLMNSSGGTLALAGSSSVTGQVTNAAGALIHLSGNSPNAFFSAVSNAGTLTIDSGASGTFYGPYTGSGPINNFGSVYFNAASISGTITGNGNLNVGNQSLPTQLQFAPLGGVSQQSSLTLSTGSLLDITNNSINLNYGSPGNDPISTIKTELANGYAGGAWTGTSSAINSSTAAAIGTLPVLSIGYSDGNVDTGAGNSTSTSAVANQVVVKFTLAGDANLDGVVNFNDLDALGRHLNTTGNDWANGNFNYDPNGVVNFNDLDTIGQNLNKALGALGSSTELGGTTVPLGEVASVQNTIVTPEPGCLALAAMGVSGLLARRRRRRN